jgi:hypothetical protein
MNGGRLWAPFTGIPTLPPVRVNHIFGQVVERYLMVMHMLPGLAETSLFGCRNGCLSPPYYQ